MRRLLTLLAIGALALAGGVLYVAWLSLAAGYPLLALAAVFVLFSSLAVAVLFGATALHWRRGR